MRGWLQRLLARPARAVGAGRRPRPNSAIYALAMHEGRAVPGTLRRLSPDGDFTQPMVSLCGSRVAYWGVGGEDIAPRIWLSSLDVDPAPVRITTRGGMQGHPFWHPDGVRIAHFDSQATTWDASRQFSPDRAPSQLWWLDTSTGATEQLTEGRFTDERPAVTPDGSAVVFVSNRSGRLNLWRVDSSGEGLEQLTDGPGPDYRPCVSPDGELLAYFTSTPDRSHQVRIRELSSDREMSTDWTRRFVWSHGPFWCGDGQSLIVHALERGAAAPALWRVDASRGHVQRLETPGLASASHGTSDAAGRWLVCDSRQG